MGYSPRQTMFWTIEQTSYFTRIKIILSLFSGYDEIKLAISNKKISGKMSKTKN